MEDEKQRQMSNQENGVSEKTFLERAKAKIGDTTIRTRVLFSVFTIGLIAIVFSTLVNLVLDPEVFIDETKRNAWLVRTLILVCITTFGIIIGEQMFLDVLMKKKDGKYQLSSQKYEERRNSVLPFFSFFSDWFVWFEAKTLRQKKISFLIQNGVDDASKFIDLLDEIEIEERIDNHKDHKGRLLAHKTLYSPILDKPMTLSNGNTIIKKTEEQLRAIKFVKDGNVTIETYSPNYYITKDDSSGEMFSIEEGVFLDKLERKDVWFRRISKILSIGGTSIFLAMTTASDFISPNDVQAWLNLIWRLFALFGALGSGASTANRVKDIRVRKINNKADVLFQYINDIKTKRFVPLTYEQRIEKEIIENGSNEDRKETD